VGRGVSSTGSCRQAGLRLRRCGAAALRGRCIVELYACQYLHLFQRSSWRGTTLYVTGEGGDLQCPARCAQLHCIRSRCAARAGTHAALTLLPYQAH